MRRIRTCCLLVLLSLFVTGCWNRTELNELGITVATGFDRENGKWSMSYQIAVPSAMGTAQSGSGGGGGGGKPSVHVFTTVGSSIREAADLGYVENPRRLYFAHTDLLVIGREAAEFGISEILGLYFRNNDARETVLVALTDGKARDILTKVVPSETMPGTALAEIIQKESNFSSIFPKVKVYELAQKVLSDAGAAGVPVLEFTGKGQSGMESLEQTTSSPGTLKLTRLGVFHRDRFVGWMNREESFGISWLSDHVKGSTLAFGCSEGSQEKKQSSFRITNAKTTVTPIKSGEHFKMKIKVKAKGDLLEFQCNGDLTKPEVIRKIEKTLEEDILAIIQAGWKASKRMRVDLPGFADKVHRKYPKTWREIKATWEDELAHIELDTEVHVSVQRPGLIKKSFEQLQKETGEQDR
ncbi:Ger(x)C family spore germination protein [Paenibacillus sp. alder61]|uniref:Ger(X)C family spore germination protein n=1 Tax=Paenibacillus faecis TaxID=862114 RepID=A0A5D0CZY7_9BACL|nr:MULTISPECIES: Ger(x)C family spore germination protein [Paenibacillus]MCA1296301.1 Ger(x)C family spore germination protein [Paenibacillus sp. alder61]TYA14135.1 Ger(x)C family spore germination protein [Paenibacillus faecis]